MKHIHLEDVKVEHQVKIGHICGDIEPNLTEDAVFLEGGEIIGFYIRNLQGKISELANIANNELLSDRVPKSMMRRSSGMMDEANEVEQFSTIIGSVPPKAHMRRPYPTISSVHNVPSAKTFIKAMLMLGKESEELIRQIAPK